MQLAERLVFTSDVPLGCSLSQAYHVLGVGFAVTLPDQRLGNADFQRTLTLLEMVRLHGLLQ